MYGSSRENGESRKGVTRRGSGTYRHLEPPDAWIWWYPDTARYAVATLPGYDAVQYDNGFGKTVLSLP